MGTVKSNANSQKIMDTLQKNVVWVLFHPTYVSYQRNISTSYPTYSTIIENYSMFFSRTICYSLFNVYYSVFGIRYSTPNFEYDPQKQGVKTTKQLELPQYASSKHKVDFSLFLKKISLISFHFATNLWLQSIPSRKSSLPKNQISVFRALIPWFKFKRQGPPFAQTNVMRF